MPSSRGLPLRPTLVAGVMTLILLAAGTTGLSAYNSSRRALSSLWRGLAGQVAENITDKSLRYLEPAVPYLELTGHLADEGRIDPDDRPAILGYFKAAIDANPEFTWASYGDETGTYVAVYRGEGGKIYGTVRDQLLAGKTTVWNDSVLGADGRFQPLLSKQEPYDPRTRSWYKAAAPVAQGVWGQPFLFTSHHQPGFFYSKRLMRNGKLHGVWAVQWEVKYLSDFLSKIRLGERGRVYVVAKNGMVVGHPDFKVLATKDGQQQFINAADHPDALLRGAWNEWSQRGKPERFAFGSYLGLAEPFPARTGIDWVVIGVVPEDDFFGEAKRQAKIAALISSICLLVAVFFGAFLANRIAHALREMSDELERIGRFELGARELIAQKSFVREVNVMGDSANRMKKSLRSFAKYVPTRLVQELMQSGSEAVLGGNKKELTILFCDIAGFTTISEKMKPDELVDALAEYFASASDAVHANGGTVDKFIGDAVMAFWGAPQEIDDAPARACRAALAIQSSVRAMSARWVAQGRPHFDVRIGINTGECLVGNIGSQQRMNYTVMGDSVNLASRLEGLNKVYGTKIMLGESTAARVKGRMLLRPLDFVAVKGKAHAVLVHELIADSPATDEKTAQAVELYSQGLELYRARRFAEAAAKFELVTGALGQADEPSRVMAERSKHYVDAPPPLAWDGSVAMKEK